MLAQVRVDEPVDQARVFDPGGRVSAITSNERHAKVTADDLARRWGIGLGTAHQLRKVTTQHGVRQAIHPIMRRYKTDLMHGSNARRIGGQWCGDMLFGPVKSLTSKIGAEVFTNTKLITVHPVETKDEAGIALEQFIEEVGVPDVLITDGAGEQTGPLTDFVRSIRRHKIHHRRRNLTAHGRTAPRTQLVS